MTNPTTKTNSAHATGDRIMWLGDMANAGGWHVVESIEQGMLSVRDEFTGRTRWVPASITETARWRTETAYRAERAAALRALRATRTVSL